ncbi:FtsX-like permease family protein [Parabacteroides sp. PF5-9]|uniref:ABC transporter permease n=1 Tax=Parabacteroides sp. PF5-9 TaxID=1742404 RepID=UPI002475EC60|nr:FtsX-like permease family protein [Parabacteroides sp. PF5-9]
MKIFTLGIGLSMGLVLIAKVYFEQSYDDFYPEKESIYQIQVNYVTLEGEKDPLKRISGGVAVGMKEMIPEVEAATRFTALNGDGVFFTKDRKKIKSQPILADTCLFDLFPRPVLAGEVKETLRRPLYALVSRKIAEHMGGVSQAVGQTFQFDNFPGKVLTVGGVFEDLPENTHMAYDLIISMNSISNFMWDGSLGWTGNERYSAYIKVVPGVDPVSFTDRIQVMKEKYLPLERLKEVGVSIDYSFLSLSEVHSGDPEVKRIMLLLSLLAFALLFTAIMNYVMIVISSLVNRSKEMAVYKCYGASENNIRNRMLMETFVDLVVSLFLAFLLIFAFRGVIQDLIDTSITALFTWQSSMLLLGVCLLVFLVSGLIPAYLFARIPVAVAFRHFTESKRLWKLGLLFLQFIAAGFFVTLLLFIGRQYNYMINNNPGYTYENLAYCDLSGVDPALRQKAVDEVGRLAEVEAVTTFSHLPFYWGSGNNIGLPDDDRDLFNISDQYWVGNGYLNMLEIPIIEGQYFRENVTVSDEVMVSRSFVDKILSYTGWQDGVIGKSIYVSEHSNGKEYLFTICGVYEEFMVGTIGSHDTRPTVLFYDTKWPPMLLIKFYNLTPEGIQNINDLLNGLMPTKNIETYSFAGEMLGRYHDSELFRNQVLLGGLITLLICLIGLIGYTNDEMSRRKKETAIRKVNGATILNIQTLFLSDISRMAIPALLFGGGIGYFVLTKWLEQFADKVSLSVIYFLLCGLFVWAIILVVSGVNCYRAATANPADSVKSE